MVGYLASIELRRRWRGIALLTLVVAVVVGTVLASVAGARRSRTAFDRYLEVVRPPDALAVGAPDLLARLPEVAGVEAALPIDLAAVFPADEPENSFFPMAVSLDGRIPADHQRYPVVDGRSPDRSAPLEVALGERTSARLGVEVGDRLPMLSLSPAAAAAVADGGDLEPDGPSFDLEVVGIVREPGDIGSRDSDLSITFLTPAFRDRFDDEEIGSLGGGSFLVVSEDSSIEAVSAAFTGQEVGFDPTFAPDVVKRQINPTMRTIATALLVFAGAAALGGGAAIAHAAGRMQQTAAAADRTLAALGVDRVGRWARLAAPGGTAILAGTVLGVGLSIVASRWFPIGLAREAEPDLGVHVDGPVLGVGAAAAVLLGFGLVGALALVTLPGAARPGFAVRASRLARSAATSGAPTPVVAGLSFATGTAGAPGRAAMTGTALGVLGIVAAAVFGASLDHLAASPGLYGWGWHANIAGAELSHVPAGAVDERALVEDPDLATVGNVDFQLSVTLDGAPARAIAAEDVKGHLRPVIVRGTEPNDADEVALGQSTLHELDKELGSPVEVDGGHGPRTMRVTGVVVLPVSADGGSSTVGAYLPQPAAEDLEVDCGEQSECYRNVAVVAAPGVELGSIVRRYTDREADIAVDLPVPPGEIERLEAVERLPYSLAAFLALLAAVAVTYVAAVTTRRRRRDLAILRVIGMSTRQVRSVVTFQVLALTLLGAVAGTALGVIVGRLVWRVIADEVSVVYAPRIPLATVLLVPLATIALTQLAASLSRRAAGRIQPAAALRTE